jgi:hypothetical protein
MGAAVVNSHAGTVIDTPAGRVYVPALADDYDGPPVLPGPPLLSDPIPVSGQVLLLQAG